VLHWPGTDDTIGRVQCVTCLPSLIHCSAVPRLLSNDIASEYFGEKRGSQVIFF
jgi:hypothetical protein